MGYQMQEALTNLSEATKALRVLVQSLERNPSMFLRGREAPPPSNPQP
jgi:paraquat-inducible protein B